jgi:hypothetical protein
MGMSAIWVTEALCRRLRSFRLVLIPVWLVLLLGALCSFLNGAPSGSLSKGLVVIAPQRFQAALTSFITHKRALLPVELVSLENVLKISAGADDPEKVKSFLFQAWRERNAGYALLVGDADVFPVRYMVLDRVTPTAFDYAFYPSDLYYADLARTDGHFDDWNARKDGFHGQYFGEVRGEKNKTDPINYDAIHYRAEIAVGRWPVSTEEEVRRIAAKSIRYETQVLKGNVPELRRAVFLAVGGWVDSRPVFEKLSTRLPSGWQLEKRYYQKDKDYGTPPPTREELIHLMNAGAGLICHAGHGDDLEWQQCFHARDLPTVKNAGHLPVMISVGCSTARFATLPPYEPYVDVRGKAHQGSNNKEVFTQPPPPPACYQSGRYNPPGLGEQLLRKDENGAVAYIGCNTGAQPCALTLLDGFLTAFGDAAEPRLGDCWVKAIAYYYDREHLETLKPTASWYPASIFFQGMKYMLYGDPSLQMPGKK